MKQAEKYQGSFWRLLKVVNVLLFFCLVILSVGAYCSYYNKKIPVPDVILNSIESELAQYGLSADFTSIGLGLDLSILAKNVSLRAYGTPEDFFRAKEVSVGLSLTRYILSGNPVRYFSVANAVASTSYANIERNPIINDVDLMLRFNDSGYSLDFLRLKIYNLLVSVNGKIDKNYSVDDLKQIVKILSNYSKQDRKQTKLSTTKIPAIIEEYDTILSKYDVVKIHLNKFEDPQFEIKFGLLNGGSNFINADFIASKINLDEKCINSSGENLKVLLRYVNTNTIEKIKLGFSIDNLLLEKFGVTTKNISARTNVNVNEKEIALFDVVVNATNAHYQDFVLNNFSAVKKMLSISSYKEDWKFFVESGKSEIIGNINIDDDNTIHCKFSSTLDVNPIFKRKELADIPEMKDFNLPHGIDIDGGICYKLGSKFPEANVRIEANDCVIMRLMVDYLSSDVTFKKGVLSCENIIAKTKEGWGAVGSYIQNFVDNSYDIYVKGNIRPMEIAHFMEPWWTKIMGAFTFEDNRILPYADVRVEGKWGIPENIWCFGYVSGKNALYNGAKFDDFSLNVWVSPKRITLYDIDIIAGEGARKGHCFIEWLYDAGEGLTSFDRQRLFLNSNLNDIELIALGGDDAKEVLDVVKFANPPELELNAVMYNSSNNPKKLKDIFNANIFARGKTSIEMIELYDARFSARSDKINTDIFNATFMFCGGESSGDVHLIRKDNSMLVDGNAKAQNMNQGLFFEFLSSLGSQNDKKNEVDKDESPLGGDGDGKVTANVTLKGDVKNMINAIGNGNISIDSKDFIKLNLFGGISKAFRAINLPVGSFDISKFEADFALENRELRLSPINMTGPALRIIGGVSYSLENDAVKGELKTYPFDNVDNSIISAVNKLVNPLMDSVRIIVSGTLKEPAFSAKITPADIIRSEKNVIKKIDETL